MKRNIMASFIIFLIISFFALRPELSWAVVDPSAAQGGAQKGSKSEKQKFKEGELLVRFKKGVSKEKVKQTHSKIGSEILRSYSTPANLYHVKVKKNAALDEIIDAYRKDPDVLYVQPNHIYKAATVPNDTSFSSLWGLNNTGSTPDADINAPEAWDVTTGSPDTIIAVIDTGVDYNHQDLAANMWVNPGEIPGNGIDDDGNGYIDDVHGINAIAGTGNPMDDYGHGTHVAGTIAATGNNAIGVVGVNWEAKIIACKFIDSTGYGIESDAIECLQYLYDLKTRSSNPVNIIASNNSWGGRIYSQALHDAIDAQRQAGVLFVAAAGNDSMKNDTFAFYPSSFYLPNIIAVAATDHTDALAWFSNYGRQSVHVAAPGDNILSTTPNNTYSTFSGTSMATPHVTGLLGLLKAQDPARDWKALKNLVLAGGQNNSSVSAKTITGKRIRAYDLNGVGSLSCGNQVVFARLRPTENAVSVGLGDTLGLSAEHINCADPNGNVTVTVSDGTQIILRDDGQGFDQEAGDGIYSAQWTAPQTQGDYTITFPGNDLVTVHVVKSYLPVVETIYSYRAITGTNLWLFDEQTASLSSPFPIYFADKAAGYKNLYISSNGTISFTENDNFRDYQNFINMFMPSFFYTTLVAPLWDDLDPGAGGGVYWQVIGSEPHRELVVEWRDVPNVDFGGTVKFQVVFFENDPSVLFNYADVSCGGNACQWGASATVGVQVASTVAQQYSYNTASLRNDLALLYTMRSFRAHAGPDRFVLPGTAVSLDGTGSYDSERAITGYSWTQTSGTPVTLTGADTATPSFTAPYTTETLTFQLTITNGTGQTSTDEVSIFVNAPPVAEAGPDQTVATGTTVSLSGAGSHDPGGMIVSYAWTQTSGTTVSLSGASTPTPTFTAPSAAGTLTFRLTVTDNSGQKSSDTVNVIVNTPPIARAGSNQTILAGTTVTLDGTGSYDPDGQIVSYSWTQTVGTSVSLIGADTATPSFTAPNTTETLEFRLSVNDNSGLSGSSYVTTIVTALYNAPQETGYDYRVITGANLNLSRFSSASITSPFPINFANVPNGYKTLKISSSGFISFNQSYTYLDNQLLPAYGIPETIAPFWDDLKPSAQANVYWEVIGSAPHRELVVEWRDLLHSSYGGSARFQVVFLENSSDILFNYADVYFGNPACDAGASATVGIQVSNTLASQYSFNTRSLRNGQALLWKITGSPTADAGPDQTAKSGTTVTLNGAASRDSDRGMVSYAWTQQAGSPVTVIGADTSTPSFTVPSSPGILAFRLTVADSSGKAASDTVSVLVQTPPVADSGPDQFVLPNASVTINGAGSHDADGVIVSYAWTQTAGPLVAMSGADTATPIFTAPNASGTLTFQLTVTDNSGFSSADTVNVILNLPPVAEAGSDKTGVAKTLVTLDGSASYDPDGTVVSYAWKQTGGTTVILAGANTATPSFTAPDTAEMMTFQLTVTDSSGQSMSDTVHVQLKRPPVANAGSDWLVSFDWGVTLDGSSSTDPDGTIVNYAWSQVAGTPVTLYDANTATPRFRTPKAVDNLTFQLTVTDNNGLTSSDTVMIRVHNDYSSVNEVPYEYRTISGTRLPVRAGLATAFELSIPFAIHFGDDPLGFDSLSILGNGNISFTPREYYYLANSVLPAFKHTTLIAPLWDDFSFDANTPDIGVFYDVVGTAPNRELVIEWRNVPHATCGGAATFQVVLFENSSDVLYNYADVVFGNTACDAGASATVGIQYLSYLALQYSYNSPSLRDGLALLLKVNAPPVANAGPDALVVAGSSITLVGTASNDPEGKIVNYNWEKTAGAYVNLIGSNTATPSFTAPATSGTLTFKLTVTDHKGATATDTVDIIVDQPPLAKADMDQQVLPGSPVTLNGAFSFDRDGAIASYSWVQTTGAHVSLTGADTATASFTAPSTQDILTFTLTVTDDKGISASDTVSIFITVPPVANAGPDQQVLPGASTTLNGAGSSDPDGTITSYRWTQSGGTSVTITGAGTSTPSFTAPNTSGTLTFLLMVTDDKGATASDTVNVIVNMPPAANAGPDQIVTAITQAVLNCTGSADSDGTISSYRWAQTAGTPVTLSSLDAAKPTFTAPDTSETLTFLLTVTDNQGATASDTVNVVVNLPPTANAGLDQQVLPSASTVLNGAGTDPDGTIASYTWVQTAGAPVALAGAGTATASFSAPNISGALTFQLTVTDNRGATSSDTVNIVVNLPPVANAGADKIVKIRSAVALSVTGSYDTDGTIAGYTWVQTSGTAVTLTGSNTATPGFTAPGTEGALTFQLTVTDNRGASASDQVTITVTKTGR